MSLWNMGDLTSRSRNAGALDLKDVTSFTLNTYGQKRAYGLCLNCVSGRRRYLRLFKWQAEKYALWKDLWLPDAPKALLYCGDRLVVGYSREYNVLSAESGSIVSSELAPPGKDCQPLIVFIQPGVIMLTTDGVGFPIDEDGNMLQHAVPTFDQPPTAVGMAYPYFVSIREGSNKAHVYATRTTRGGQAVCQLVQTVGVHADARRMCAHRTSTPVPRAAHPPHSAFIPGSRVFTPPPSCSARGRPKQHQLLTT
ncbi:hypothetical protein EON62_02105 [archaeon]|nr:MAG: hypothetical protein EON62_02105 [archaeon]